MLVAAVSQVPPMPRRGEVRAASRALVPVQAAVAAPLLPCGTRPAAGLLAQLIAHREGLDWTRERRRAAPGVALEAYRASARRPVPAAQLRATA